MNSLRKQIEQAVDVGMNMGMGHGQEQVTVDQYINARDQATDRIMALFAEAMLSSDTRKRCVAAFGDPLEGEDMEWYEDVLLPITYGTVDTVLTTAAACITGEEQEGAGDSKQEPEGKG